MPSSYLVIRLVPAVFEREMEIEMIHNLRVLTGQLLGPSRCSSHQLRPKPDVEV